MKRPAPKRRPGSGPSPKLAPAGPKTRRPRLEREETRDDRAPAPRPAKPTGRAKQRESSPPRDIRRGPEPGRPEPSPAFHENTSTHVVPLDKLARAAVETAEIVWPAVLNDKKHADRAIAAVLRERRELGQNDKMFISQAVFALFRWKGWLDTLPLERMEAKLLFAWLLDAPSVHPACRLWARAIDRDVARVVALGGAPSWTARAEGWKRLNEGFPVTADPWRLFPTWLREHLPIPPGSASPKVKYLEFLHALQARPSLWVRSQTPEPRAVWNELGELGLKPWVHRRMLAAAKLNPGANLHQLQPFKAGRVEIQDLSSQAVALVCDPDEGERWWDACAGAGGKALHLAALMQGKGVVVATDVSELKLREAVRRARRSPFRNVTTKVWDGKHLVGKSGSFDGVLIDAPCSGIGTWRRNPDARWTLDKEAIPRLAAVQTGLLNSVARAVKPGGTLVYSVCTLTIAETQDVVKKFLAEHTEYKLDPFPHPFTGETTEGTALLWPQDSDNDTMFVARMIRTK